ncbi:MAG: helix-turn-helix domain-containing protein [Clostridia bacterium]|nr:helix-turn-helix domain-containing protein [Clostridia bacterium]
MMEKKNHRTVDFKILKESRMGQAREESERFHRYHELYYIAEGKCSVFIGQRTYRLQTGDFALIPAGTLHKTDFTSHGQNTKYVISFSVNTARQIDAFLETEIAETGIRAGKIKAPVQRQEAVLLLVNRMLYEFENQPPLGRSLCLALLAELLISLQRYRAGEAENDGIEDTAHGRMREVAAYLCEHSREQITLSEVAAHFAVSPSHLSRVFHRETGFGLREYLVHYRIRQACDLLLNSDLSVTQIADQCGFSDSNYFGDAFKKATGLSPREYRKLS